LPRLRKQEIESTIDRSLERLGVERIDRVQFHWWDFSVAGWIEAYGWLDELRQAGKIAEIAVTNFDLARLQQLVDSGLPVASHQLQYSILDRRPAREMAAFCIAHGIEMLCYGALAGGLLGGRWSGVDRPKPDAVNRSIVKYLLIVEECGGWEPFQRRLQQLQRIAERHQRSVANVATRWLLDQPGVSAAIIGAADDRWLKSNLQTLDFELTDDERTELSAGQALHGEIYGLEREVGGRHAEIMRYDLNRSAQK
jgi:aryl-alcohol dehydrogenase-like predicted oxidoreductase